MWNSLLELPPRTTRRMVTHWWNRVNRWMNTLLPWSEPAVRTFTKPYRCEAEKRTSGRTFTETERLDVLFQCAWYVVRMVGLIVRSQAPLAPVRSVATRMGDACPTCCA